MCNHTLDLHARGFEIGDHTRTHPSLKGLRSASLRDEVLGAQEDLVSCGVPEQDIAGLRAPFLESDAALRGLLAGNSFLYDRWAGHCKRPRRRRGGQVGRRHVQR